MDCLFVFSLTSSKEQKFLILMKSDVLVFDFIFLCVLIRKFANFKTVFLCIFSPRICIVLDFTVFFIPTNKYPVDQAPFFERTSFFHWFFFTFMKSVNPVCMDLPLDSVFYPVELFSVFMWICSALMWFYSRSQKSW